MTAPMKGRKCTIEGCNNILPLFAHSLCHDHRKRPSTEKQCKYPGCENKRGVRCACYCPLHKFHPPKSTNKTIYANLNEPNQYFINKSDKLKQQKAA